MILQEWIMNAFILLHAIATSINRHAFVLVSRFTGPLWREILFLTLPKCCSIVRLLFRLFIQQIRSVDGLPFSPWFLLLLASTLFHSLDKIHFFNFIVFDTLRLFSVIFLEISNKVIALVIIILCFRTSETLFKNLFFKFFS